MAGVVVWFRTNTVSFNRSLAKVLSRMTSSCVGFFVASSPIDMAVLVFFGHIALLQPVALNQHVAAIWDVDQVARIAIRAVGDVYQHVDTCKRFDVVTDMLVGETGMDLKPIDRTDVDAVRASTVALAVAAEVAVHDANGAAARGVGEDTVFVVDEFAVLDCQIATFGADPRPVLVRHRGALEGDIADGYVVAVGGADFACRTHLL
jgi:hypothetical protein